MRYNEIGVVVWKHKIMVDGKSSLSFENIKAKLALYKFRNYAEPLSLINDFQIAFRYEIKGKKHHELFTLLNGEFDKQSLDNISSNVPYVDYRYLSNFPILNR